MSNSPLKTHVSPVLVGIAAWVIPGGGYFLLKEKSRAITVFVSVMLLFLMGILIGGIRVMDPPGWGEYGYRNELVGRKTSRQSNQLDVIKIEPSSLDQAQNPTQRNEVALGPAIIGQPMAELSDKPWFVCQILIGPTTLATSAISVEAARPKMKANPPQEGTPASHSRSWEIGALYTAVAGMLNLLVIIDSAYRAAQFGDQAPTPESDPLPTASRNLAARGKSEDGVEALRPTGSMP